MRCPGCRINKHKLGTAMRPTARTYLPATVTCLLILSVSPAVTADELQPYEKRELHEFEQCANLCQRGLDTEIFQCAPYRSEQDKPAPEDCGKLAYEAYDVCMNACPVDPRLRR